MQQGPSKLMGAGHIGKIIIFSVKYRTLTLSCLASHFWDLGKQCRPRSDAAEWASDQGLHCLLTGFCIWNIIRAVAGQCSLPELCLAIKTKCIWSKKKKELKIASARVLGCSIFWPPAPPNGMYPGVSSYGMEADPPRFLYLKDDCFLTTDWCNRDISLIMKNSKSVTWTSKSVRRCRVGMEQRKNFRPVSNIRCSIN